MKLFFASDIHGCLLATEKVLEKFQHSQCDYLILLGDILNHGPRNPIPEHYNPAHVAERLNEYAQKIIAVRGNCDSEVDQMLLNFPITSSYNWLILSNGVRLFLTHGHLYHPQSSNLPLAETDILVYGHTHISLAETVDDVRAFNPGSITLPKGGQVRSYGLLENEKLYVLNLENDEVLAMLDTNR